MARQKILIADDSEMNREMLIDILGDQYEIVEVENGREAVAALQENASEFSLVLLDIMMPELDGFGVLAFMNKYHWIDEVPVIMISAETAPSYIERAYDFGVTDYISRPFDVAIVRRRVENTMLLTAKQRRLTGLVTEQIYEKEKSNQLMISILSHIVEFRNGESGLHVLHISAITEILLRYLARKTDRYALTKAAITRISTASALHDIGKISIADEVLNKPGRLTPEEFEIIKTHSINGAEMLDKLPKHQRENELVQCAYEICRWHHERFDGRGYPDGLKGDEIPIGAQVVSLADVYDALTSERCYKKAIPHEKAIQMILDGECGAFNPILLECLQETADILERETRVDSFPEFDAKEIRNIEEQLHNYELSSAERTLNLLDYERQRVQFLSDNIEEIIFSFMVSPPVFSMSKYGAKLFGIEEVTGELAKDQLLKLKSANGDGMLRDKLKQATPDAPLVEADIEILRENRAERYHCICKTIWNSKTDEKYMGLIAKMIPVA